MNRRAAIAMTAAEAAAFLEEVAHRDLRDDRAATAGRT